MGIPLYKKTGYRELLAWSSAAYDLTPSSIALLLGLFAIVLYMAGLGVMHRQAMPGTHFSSPSLRCLQPLRVATVQASHASWLGWIEVMANAPRCLFDDAHNRQSRSVQPLPRRTAFEYAGMPALT
jgi:hypothetical protein